MACPRPRSSPSCESTRAAIDDVIEPLPAGLLIRERLAGRADALRAAHFPEREEDGEVGRRRLAFDELLLVQLVLLRRRRQRRASARAPVLDDERSLTARWLSEMLPFPLTGDQLAALDAVDADLAQSRADAAAADGGGRVGQDRRRSVRDAAGGRARPPGGDDGPDGDARRATLRDDPVADARLGGADRTADRVDAGPAARRSAGEAVLGGAVADRRHPRADRGRRTVRAARSRRRRRAAPLRRAPAGRARRQGAGGREARTSST